MTARSTRTSRELQTAWIASAAFHLLMFLLLFFTQVPQAVRVPQIIELAWGGISSEAESSLPGGSPGIALPLSSPSPALTPVALPERKFADPTSEALAVPRTDKLAADQQAGVSGASRQPGTTGERSASGAVLRGTGERGTGSTPGSRAGRFDGGGQGSPGSGVGKGVGFSVEWLTGAGTRRKLSGDLPKYPDNVNVEAQIKILTVVLPDGSVKAVQPAQKGNTRLEDAAMQELRFWKFEALPAGIPQVEQRCVVSFLFRLR